MQILFYDLATPFPYDLQTLKEKGLGGTEATVVRVAHALKDLHEVYIAQHCREKRDEKEMEGVHYLSLERAAALKPDVLVLLRQYQHAEAVAERFPSAKKYLWLHNMPSKKLYHLQDAIAKANYEIIAVSHFHQRAIQKRLAGNTLQKALRLGRAKATIPVQVVYAPIADTLEPDQTPWKPNQLLFMSSPQKGLAESLEKFVELRKHYPEYQLVISNPGYNLRELTLPEQASFLGVLTHQQVIQTCRESFCVFYPQQERVETFGLIYAEANAVGTPVLANDAGAASEVLSDPGQLVDGGDFSSILAKIREWREQRPTLKAKEEFRLEKVKERWINLLA